jgi:hypothetical protein
MSPEMILGETEYSYPADIWFYGLFASFLANG